MKHLPSVVVAPMAGGPSTPELVNAVRFGFLSSGSSTAEQLAEDMARTNGAYGVNLFCPQGPTPRYPLAVDLSFGWEAKLAAILAALADGHGPKVVSSTFGSFPPEVAERLHHLGVELWVTVTTPEEAHEAAEVADALIVQGPEAGGHRATWSATAEPDSRPLAELVTAVAEVSSLPLIAAGGISTRADVLRALAWPQVVAVSCGTAFLQAAEAGTSELNRTLLARGEAEAVVTRAFSGRYARGLETTYTRNHPDLGPGYPYHGIFFKFRRNQEDYAYCLAGVGYRQSQARPAAEIETELLGESDE